jgi:hypothetical protein
METGEPSYIVRAIDIALKTFGAQEIATRLDAPSDLVEAWRTGRARMPARALLALLDMLDKVAELEYASRAPGWRPTTQPG